ncbi:glycerophosphodiester phosphodiesterase [Deinococcus budaensis]|uniref:Glycerophosphoryl diester phosphodiesterase n=1 Tax=Deinococcus budaensis TaxID=1665626 RepID=A0A7W8GDK7_9DEIO|nr:glycerophosphodiester phosphodiesterase [Deinococcus budaensis]MBB5233533.1 glycerophosphoryl diester phosphodiesterase [Deinococcus budaensis]
MNRLWLAGLGALLLGACALLPGSANPPANPFVQGRTLNIAHQGGEGLRPSNTLLAYRNAASLGADMLEMDMHATRDGVLVLSHDAALDRLTNVRGRIPELTLAQVRAADAGYAFSLDGGRTFPFRGQGVQVAQLSEVLSAFPALPMIIEIKQASPSLAAPFCRALRDAGATRRVIAASFSDVALNEFRAACPEVMTSMTERELRPLVLLSKVGLARLAPVRGRAAQVPVRAGRIEVVTPGFVRAMQARGVAVQVWTVNDPAEMRRLIRLGVDGIITDRPDLLEEVLTREAQGR